MEIDRQGFGVIAMSKTTVCYFGNWFDADQMDEYLSLANNVGQKRALMECKKAIGMLTYLIDTGRVTPPGNQWWHSWA